jgi:hypothetical protein
MTPELQDSRIPYGMARTIGPIDEIGASPFNPH